MKKFVLLMLLAMLLQACDRISTDSPPNIIFIMSDDHASKAISAYDSSLVITPNIDRLTDNGIRFDNCYCTNAICAPSRAVILTGKYSHMNGVLDNSRPFDGEQQTLPKILQKAGYQTAIIGKWHLKSEPTGFDHWMVLPGQGQYYKPDFLTEEGRITIEGYVTDIITDKSIEYLEGRDEKKPFFLMLHHKAPHRNWQPAIRHLDIYDQVNFPPPGNLEDDFNSRSNAAIEQEMTIARHMSLDYDLKLPDSLVELKNLDQELLFHWGDDRKMRKRLSPDNYAVWQSYYHERANEYNALPDDPSTITAWKYQQYMEDYLSCIHTVDESIGRLLDYLEDSGLDENTIVIYTSDQGFFLGEHGWYDKRFMYEEAHKMPLLIWGPDMKGLADKHMITNADFAPTILDLAGIDAPDDMQGASFADVIKGKDMLKWRDAVYYHYYEYPAVHAVNRHYGIRTDKYKLIHFYYDIDEWELYDLKKDPGEMNNLVDDPVYAVVLDEMKRRLNELQKEHQDTNYEQYLPVYPDTLYHLAKDKPYIMRNMPAPRYSGEFMELTNGLAYPEGEMYQVSKKGWCGFSGEDFIIELDLIDVVNITSIKVGFLQDQNSWIFLPRELEFQTSIDGRDFMKIPVSSCDDLVKDDKVMKIYAKAEYPGTNIRYIKIIAKNNILPEWHAGAGKAAWLFVDEIIVEGE